ncbi:MULTISPECIES: phosphate ABC transporter substrate-binding protein PstS [Sphingosinicellaceae]|uniref:phosphate ABC transporter substrate-binding protein PstS n=1 Tax=Sphingosinicellaceae TaxID=2820280 RepID=UPI001C1E031D|nr:MULTISPECIES: phosphate ABC transporter substrate-binding protein PstS [Polymorphobacter]QYE36519.1 phosphate ABC transporter substrate-binding protein PstS [Polymorphobacter sp. PAMC 29334]UAJ09989.1 phosphate ABC transporter substrate-binding protein PstS [Polymorphobacter megasporae]
MTARFTRAALLLASAVISTTAFAADITGAGGTFPAPLYAKWGSAYKAATGNALNYQAIGSGGGQTQIKARTVDFGASDDPMKAEDISSNGLVQFPAVIGSAVMIVNLPGVASGQLKLTPDVIGAIYEGKITKWNDPAIVALNKGVTLRPMPITPVYRSDSSGTTAIFSNYMTKAAKGWSLGAGKTLSWPAGSGGKGNDGVAGTVKNTVGGVGYVEYNYAFANKLTMTKLSNAAGKFIDPTPASFTAAASQADWAHAPNGVANMLALPGANTWPIVSATYILVPAKPTDPKKTSAALAFFDWSFKNGAKTAVELGYVPLPPVALQEVRAAWKGVAGASLPK